MNHEEITRVVTANGTQPYGVGIKPNPYADQQAEWKRRRDYARVRKLITEKIESLFEPRFLTPPETSELIEAIVTATDSRKVLELGTCTGFATLHMLRALIGKEGARLVSIDARPAHDKDFWSREEFKGVLEFFEGWTPDVLTQLAGTLFDLVFIDSDHSIDHTSKELGALWPITQEGTVFLMHDLPAWQSQDNHTPIPVRDYMMTKVKDGTFDGVVVPTCEQMDCVDAFGPGYNPKLNPHLGIFIRR